MSEPIGALGPLIEADLVTKRYRLARSILGKERSLLALDRVSLSVAHGESVAIVGESGCGKSTLARCLIGLSRPTSGRVLFEGSDIWNMPSSQKRMFRRRVQPVFQDAFSSLDPRWTVDQTLSESLELAGVPRASRNGRLGLLLDQVGLPSSVLHQRPGEMSGGQCQRVGIAAALALEPRVLVADEPVSALDVSVRAQVLNLLSDLRRELHLTLILITHDMAVVEHISDRVAVMYLGQVVEIGFTADVMDRRIHPYTDALVEAIPRPDPGRRMSHRPIVGEVPSALAPPSGCRFHPRCPLAVDDCHKVEPTLTNFGKQRNAACLVMAARLEPNRLKLEADSVGH